MHCDVGGEPGWVVIARTRHEDIHVGSVATSLSLTVLAITTHPGSGHAGGIPMDSTIVAEGVWCLDSGP